MDPLTLVCPVGHSFEPPQAASQRPDLQRRPALPDQLLLRRQADVSVALQCVINYSYGKRQVSTKFDVCLRQDLPAWRPAEGSTRADAMSEI
jgi:hypothetical protein